MARPFQFIVWLSMVWLTLLGLYALSGCGASPKAQATRIDPATVSLADHYHDQDKSNERAAKITITPPPSPPTPVAATMPGITLAPTTQPITVNVFGQTITAPAGTAITAEVHDSEAPKMSDYQRSANAAGPSLHTDKDAGSFNAEAPKVGLDKVDIRGATGGGAKGGGGDATGGDAESSWKGLVAGFSAISRIAMTLGAIGIAALLAAIGYVIFERFIGGQTDWPLAIGGGVVGLFFLAAAIVAESHPVIFLFLFLGLVGVGAWYVWHWYQKEHPAVPPAPAPGG